MTRSFTEQLVAGSESNQKFREEIRAVSLETSSSGTAVLVVLVVLAVLIRVIQCDVFKVC